MKEATHKTQSGLGYADACTPAPRVRGIKYCSAQYSSGKDHLPSLPVIFWKIPLIAVAITL